MKKTKLVRDKIPELIKKQGGNPVTHIANDAEYWEKLKGKLAEEFTEFKEDESIEEFADMLEVIRAISKYKGFDEETTEQVRSKKFGERGGFENWILLEIE